MENASNGLKLIIYWKRQRLETTEEYLRERCFAGTGSAYFPATRFVHDASENFFS
jgi:hypothetical protein